MKKIINYLAVVSCFFLVFVFVLYFSLAFRIGKEASRDTKTHSDVILVLGAKAYHGSSYNPCLVSRITHAVDLYKTKYAPKILVSGGFDREDHVNEAETMKKIATQTGTTNEKEALKYTSDRLVIRYPDFIQATKALVDGNVDALFTDLPNAKGIISKNSGLKIVSDPFTKEYYGIVFIKGDPSVTQINEALTSLRKRGVLADLEKKWLN